MSEPYTATMGPAAESMPDLTGCVVDDRYQLLTMLGAGAFGVVYHALDIDPLCAPDRMDVAVKVISKSCRSLAEVETVRREVALQVGVSGHPNVVQVYDAFEDDEYYFIVLDLCRGGDLYEQVCVKEVYEGNDELLRGAFLSLISAVQACHKARIFHRDLKPENIMTNEDGSEVYVADFGLATDQRTSNDHRVGTEGYMSPECWGSLAGNRPYCTRFSDIWALGVILVNMITGRQPWVRPESEDDSFARFLTEPDFLKTALPISDSAHAVLQRIFVLNPIRRITLTDLRRAILDVDTFFAERSEDEIEDESEYAAVAHAGIDMRCGGLPSDRAVVGSVGCVEEDVEEAADLRSNSHSLKKARLSDGTDADGVFVVARFPIVEDSDESSVSSKASSTGARAGSEGSSTTPEKPAVALCGPCIVQKDFSAMVCQRPKRKHTHLS